MVIILLLTILCLLAYILEYLLYCKVNQSPLSIETIEGTGQAFHPSVLFIDKPWKGYRYWMAETPYPVGVPPYRDRWECPSIHVSNDGLNWYIPEGLTNPIDDLLPSEIVNKDFFSDPHLVLRNDHLECFYRFSKKLRNGFHTCLIRKKSYDGIIWQDRETLLDYSDTLCLQTIGDMVRSPAILWMDGKYMMWYVDNSDTKGIKHVCYSESVDCIHWAKRTICTLKGFDISPWHLDLNYFNGEYFLTVYDLHTLTLWKGKDGQSFIYIKTILSPSRTYGSFYSDGLYRSSLIKDSEGYKLYFSAYDDKQTRIGLMVGSDLSNLMVYSVNGPNKSIGSFLKTFFMIWKVRIWTLLQTLKCQHPL